MKYSGLSAKFDKLSVNHVTLIVPYHAHVEWMNEWMNEWMKEWMNKKDSFTLATASDSNQLYEIFRPARCHGDKRKKTNQQN